MKFDNSGQDSTLISGIIVASIIGIIAIIFDRNVTFSLGSGVTAFIIGAIIVNENKNLEVGGRWIIRNLLPLTIILLGFGLNLSIFFESSLGKFGIIIGIMSAIACLTTSYFLGKIWGLETSTSLALGSGGAICGNSAVVAASKPLRLDEETMAVILAVINILGVLTFLLIPILSLYWGFSEIEAGIWAGSTIHAVPQAVSAGEIIGEDAMIMATTVKLSRVALLVLLIPIFTIIGNKISNEENYSNEKVNIPFFVPGFVLASVISTWFLPELITDFLVNISKFLLVIIMASIGFFINRSGIRDFGSKLMIIGLISSLIMIIVSFFMISWF